MHKSSTVSLVIIFALAFCNRGSLAAEKLNFDAEKSKIGFVGGKPDKSTHEGGFKKFQVEAQVDNENPENSSMRIEIDTASLWSDNPKLTGHLKNPDFFNVRKYPKAVFESTKIDHSAKGSVVIHGKLKMLDKTQEIKIPLKTEVSDSGLKLIGDFEIDRTKWGMNYGADEGKINKEVKLSVEIAFKR